MRLALIAALMAFAAPAHADDPTGEALACAFSPDCVERVEAAHRKVAADAQAASDMVRDRLAEACVTLYATEPDRTITNPLCYEVFISQGLPD